MPHRPEILPPSGSSVSRSEVRVDLVLSNAGGHEAYLAEQACRVMRSARQPMNSDSSYSGEPALLTKVKAAGEGMRF